MIPEQTIEGLNNIMPTLGDIFMTIFYSIVYGENPFELESILLLIKNIVRNEINGVFGSLQQIVIIIISGVVISRISSVFKNSQLAGMTYYIVYLGMIKILLDLFFSFSNIIKELIDCMIRFTEILIPIFYVAVAANGRVETANYFYYFTVLVLYLVSFIFPKIIIPLITIFVFVSLINGMNKEIYFNKIIELIRRGISLSLKLCLAFVSGISVVKSMVFPAIDVNRTGAIVKFMKGLPGIGDLSESVSGLVIGSAKLIKDGLGASILLLLAILISVPVLRVFSVSVVLKMIAAVTSVSGDKQMPDVVEKVSEGGFLLVKSALTVSACFFIIIAMVSMAS